MSKVRKDLVKRIIEISHKVKEGHIGSSLSVLDILFVLYGKILKKNLNYFILSKGHASLGLYTILEYFDLLDDNLENMCRYDSKLGGHPSSFLKNITASTGSLGHGLPIGVGIAISEKIKGTNKNVYVLIGDGESNEGTIWESALLSSNHNLDNLYCVLDYNHSNDRSLNLGNLLSKFESFGWNCLEIDGHDEKKIFSALTTKCSEKPTLVIANTIKGKGCKPMENNPEWHHKFPTDEDIQQILKNIY